MVQGLGLSKPRPYVNLALPHCSLLLPNGLSEPRPYSVAPIVVPMGLASLPRSLHNGHAKAFIDYHVFICHSVRKSGFDDLVKEYFDCKGNLCPV